MGLRSPILPSGDGSVVSRRGPKGPNAVKFPGFQNTAFRKDRLTIFLNIAANPSIRKLGVSLAKIASPDRSP